MRGNIITNKLKAEMIRLRLSGWSWHKLGRYFGVDHSTVIYHVKRAGIDIKETKSSLKKPSRHLERVEMKINRPLPGKVYKDYLQEEENRKYQKLLAKGGFIN